MAYARDKKYQPPFYAHALAGLLETVKSLPGARNPRFPADTPHHELRQDRARHAASRHGVERIGRW